MSGQRAPAIAVLGCGQWGMNHVRVWNDLGLLVAVADPDPGRRSLVADAYPGVVTSATTSEVLARPDVAAVVVATPATTHAAIATQALEAGKHVLVEKPLAMSADEGTLLVNRARDLDRTLMVGHVLEFHPAVLALRRLVDDGVLGRVRYLYSNRLSFGRLRTDENAMWSFAPHDIALCLRIVGRSPTDVTCRGAAFLSPEVADVTLMGLTFPGGTQAHVFVSWLHPFKEHRFVVVGDRQMAVFDDTAPWPEKLVLYPHQVDWVGGTVPVARKAEGVAVALDPDEPLVAECRHFAEAVSTGSRPLTDGEGALSVLRVLSAGDRSLRAGGAPVTLDSEVTDSEVAPPAFVHSTATVDPGAAIGAGSSVWHYTHVMDGSEIGRNCSLGQNVFVASGVRIGDNVRIQNNVSVYEGVELDDGVFCGPSMVFTNVKNPRAETPTSVYATTAVGRGATLGANCTIVCGITIGAYSLVGAGAVVTRDVPAHGLVAGVPAVRTGWVSHTGARLSFDDGRAVCPDSGCAYVLDDGRVSAAAESTGN